MKRVCFMHVEAADARHVQVDDDCVEAPGSRARSSTSSPSSTTCGLCPAFSSRRRRPSVGRLVVGDQDAHRPHAGAMADERIGERDDVACADRRPVRCGCATAASADAARTAVRPRNAMPPPLRLSEADLAAEQFGQRLGDGGAQAGAAEAAATAGIRPARRPRRCAPRRLPGMPMPVSRTEKRRRAASPSPADQARRRSDTRPVSVNLIALDTG